jgi:hypothetical protein
MPARRVALHSLRLLPWNLDFKVEVAHREISARIHLETFRRRR